VLINSISIELSHAQKISVEDPICITILLEGKDGLKLRYFQITFWVNQRLHIGLNQVSPKLLYPGKPQSPKNLWRV